MRIDVLGVGFDDMTVEQAVEAMEAVLEKWEEGQQRLTVFLTWRGEPLEAQVGV